MTEMLVVPRSKSGQCIFEADDVNAANMSDFEPCPNRRGTAVRHLRALGFDVRESGGPALIVRGPAARFEKKFDAQSRSGRARIPGLIPVTARRHGELSQVVSGIAVPQPIRLFAAPAVLPTPPSVEYHHFVVPEGVAKALNATDAHRGGATGKGVTVAICDSGVARHPFFTSRDFRIRRMCTSFASDPARDEVGHGTAVAANLLSVAPGASVISIKMNFSSGDSTTADSIDALQIAAKTKARVINCSWGQNVAERKSFAADARVLGYIALWLAHTGRIVVAASGDYPRGDPKEKGIYGWPAQHPTVIAVGGAYVRPDGQLAAASYASGFASKLYSARYLPDVCGLCGGLPAGVLIMSPVSPGGAIDQMAARNPYPNGDNTAPTDGWACFSGTSLAAPQVVGAVALLLEANPSIGDHHAVRASLMLSARNVQRGHSNPNATHSDTLNRAHKGWNVATGAGLIDVSRLLKVGRALAVKQQPAAVSLGARKRSSRASRKGTAKPRP